MAGEFGVQAGLVARKEALTAILIALVVASACRLSYLAAAYTVGYGGVLRHHVETTATIFALLGAALALATRRGGGADGVAAAASVRRPGWLLPAFCAGALALYWPALSIGLLSDDFGLMHRAASWDVSAVSSTLFRPVPLLIWSAILNMGGGATGLHVLNVVLHGVNAWLTVRVLDAWVPGRWPLAGGLLMVTAPIAAEAVVWCSGIFDVSAATLALTAVLAARSYGHGAPQPRTRAGYIAASLLAVLCKETAAVAPLLVLLCAGVGRSAPGRSTFRRDTLVVITVVAAFGIVRMLAHPEPALFHVTKYALQRALFASFGSLAMPFHTDVVEVAPWMAVGATVLVICLWTVFFVTPASTHTLATIARGLAFVLIAVAPVWPILVGPADLQGSRYLYLAAVGWILALVAAASASTGRSSVAAWPAVAILMMVVAGVAATRAHLWHWQDAAEERDVFLSAIVDAGTRRGCPDVAVSNAPDMVRGAYVFRNSLSEALAARGVTLAESPQRADCAFSWDARRGALVPR